MEEQCRTNKDVAEEIVQELERVQDTDQKPVRGFKNLEAEIRLLLPGTVDDASVLYNNPTAV